MMLKPDSVSRFETICPLFHDRGKKCLSSIPLKIIPTKPFCTF